MLGIHLSFWFGGGGGGGGDSHTEVTGMLVASANSN